MHDSRLLTLLKTLSGKEWSQLEAYLSGHGSTYNLSLFRELRKYAPGFRSKSLRAATFLAQWPEGENWTENQLRQHTSKLTALVEEGLAWLRLQEEEWRLQLSLFAIGHERGLDYLVRKAQRRIEKLLEAYPLHDQAYYLRCYEWAMQQHEFADSGKRGFQPELQQASIALDRFFAFEKTRQLWQMANLENMLEVQYDHGLKCPVEEELPAYVAQDEVRSIYTRVLALTMGGEGTEAEWEGFRQVQNQIREYHSVFPIAEAQQLYTSLLNYCTRQINRTGADRYRRAYFELNRTLLEQGWLQEKGELSPWRYINMAAAALSLGEAAWAQAFIGEYQEQLPEQHRENAYHYAMGQYCYSQNAFGDARQHLMQVTFEEPLFNAGVRLLLVKVFYDAGEEELLHNQLEANRLFFLRDKTIDDNRKAQLEAFNHFLKRLARTPAFEKEDLKALKAGLPGPDRVISRDWLEKRLDQRIEE